MGCPYCQGDATQVLERGQEARAGSGHVGWILGESC